KSRVRIDIHSSALLNHIAGKADGSPQIITGNIGVASMVIHSGSLLFALAYLVTLATAMGLVISVGILVARKFRTAAKIAAASVAALAFYFVAATTIWWVSPGRVIKLGDSYCWDLWCMGIDKVNATPRGQEMIYKIDVHFFSDAN